MTSKNTYWLADAEGNHAQVTGAEERDRLIPLGWTVADDEPAGTTRVWAWHEGVEKPAQFPADVFRDAWEPKGWQAGPPPGSDHPFAEQPAPVQADSSSAAPAESTSKPRKARTAAAESDEE